MKFSPDIWNFYNFQIQKRIVSDYLQKYGTFHKSSSSQDFIWRTLICSLLEILVRRATIADLCDLSILHKVVFQTWRGKFNTYFNRWQNVKGPNLIDTLFLQQCKGNLKLIQVSFPSGKKIFQINFCNVYL